MKKLFGLDLPTLLLARVRELCWFVGLGVLGALAFMLFAPKWYEASLSVVPAQRTQSATAGLAAALPGLASLASPLGTDVERIEAVLNTNAVADSVIAKFNLMVRYDKQHIEHARIALRKHCSTKANRKSGVVVLVCEDKSPKVARDMAAYFGEVGNQVFGRVSGSSAGEERRFLEQRVAEAKRDVEQASQKLRDFQERYKIVDIGEQSKAVISAMASIQGELLSKEIQLSYVSGFASGADGNVLQLRQQVGILRQKLKQLEAAAPAADGGKVGSDSRANQVSKTFFPDAMSVPELRFQLEPLIRELKVQETVLLLLTQRYETAKVDEARDTSTFQILDPPTLPTYKARPLLAIVLLVGVLAGLCLGVGYAVWDELRGRRRSRTTAALSQAT